MPSKKNKSKPTSSPQPPSQPPSQSPSQSSSQSSTKPTKPTKPIKPQKLFGLMTKRRWLSVGVFLLGVLWSYTAGPPLDLAHISNEYFIDSIPYDYSTISKEGSENLINSLFPILLFPNTFTWQVGSNFNLTHSPIWQNNRLLFTDIITNTLYSWSKYNGIQIEEHDFVKIDKTTEKNLIEPGASGIIVDNNDPNILYVAEHGTRQITKRNLKTKQIEVVASKYQNKRFNSPQDLIFNKNDNYLYFIDSDHQMSTESEIGFNGLYRIKIVPFNKYAEVELISKDIPKPNGIIFNNQNNKLYVSNCVKNKFDLYVFDVNNNNNNIQQSAHWDEQSLKWNNTKIEGGVGCTGGLAIHPKGYLFVACPGGKVCIINEKTGIMEIVIKLSDNVDLTNLLIAGDGNLYLTGNHTAWQIQLLP